MKFESAVFFAFCLTTTVTASYISSTKIEGHGVRNQVIGPDGTIITSNEPGGTITVQEYPEGEIPPPPHPYYFQKFEYQPETDNVQNFYQNTYRQFEDNLPIIHYGQPFFDYNNHQSVPLIGTPVVNSKSPIIGPKTNLVISSAIENLVSPVRNTAPLSSSAYYASEEYEPLKSIYTPPSNAYRKTDEVELPTVPSQEFSFYYNDQNLRPSGAIQELKVDNDVGRLHHDLKPSSVPFEDSPKKGFVLHHFKTQHVNEYQLPSTINNPLPVSYLYPEINRFTELDYQKQRQPEAEDSVQIRDFNVINQENLGLETVTTSSNDIKRQKTIEEYPSEDVSSRSSPYHNEKYLNILADLLFNPTPIESTNDLQLKGDSISSYPEQLRDEIHNAPEFSNLEQDSPLPNSPVQILPSSDVNNFKNSRQFPSLPFTPSCAITTPIGSVHLPRDSEDAGPENVDYFELQRQFPSLPIKPSCAITTPFGQLIIGRDPQSTTQLDTNSPSQKDKQYNFQSFPGVGYESLVDQFSSNKELLRAYSIHSRNPSDAQEKKIYYQSNDYL